MRCFLLYLGGLTGGFVIGNGFGPLLDAIARKRRRSR